MRETNEGRDARSRSKSRTKAPKREAIKETSGKMRGILVKTMSSRAFSGGSVTSYCRAFNGQDCKNSQCQKRHMCDVMINGKDCDKPHSRQDHQESDGAWTEA